MTAPLTPDAAPIDQIFHPPGLLMPAKALGMIDYIESYDPQGGPQGIRLSARAQSGGCR